MHPQKNIDTANACPCRCVATRSHDITVLIKVGENQPTSRNVRFLVFSTVGEGVSRISPYHLDSAGIGIVLKDDVLPGISIICIGPIRA